MIANKSQFAYLNEFKEIGIIISYVNYNIFRVSRIKDMYFGVYLNYTFERQKFSSIHLFYKCFTKFLSPQDNTIIFYIDYYISTYNDN